MVFPRAVRMPQAGAGADWPQPAPVERSQSAHAAPLQGEAARPAQRRHRLNSSKRIPQPPHLEAQLPHQRIEPRQRGWQYCDSLLVAIRNTVLVYLAFSSRIFTTELLSLNTRRGVSERSSPAHIPRATNWPTKPGTGYRIDRIYISLFPEDLELSLSTKSIHCHHTSRLFA